MTKYTKRQYVKDLAANEAEKAFNDAFLESLSYRLEIGEDAQILADAWSAAYGAEWDIQNERKDIERRFATRNWNWQDHSLAALVSANID